jgi:hypothetical protein
MGDIVRLSYEKPLDKSFFVLETVSTIIDKAVHVITIEDGKNKLTVVRQK